MQLIEVVVVMVLIALPPLPPLLHCTDMWNFDIEKKSCQGEKIL